jgi:hypothetical protein
MQKFEILTKESKTELDVITKVLHILIFSYAIGWAILAWHSRSVPLLDDFYWRITAFVIFALTLWLGYTLSIRSLIWWTAAGIMVVTVRSFAYASDGTFSPLGVWLLVLSGIAVTDMAVIAVHGVTGRLQVKGGG